MTALGWRIRQERLEDELERLKKMMKMCYELRVRWVPNESARISGVVKGAWILIYDEDVEVALETLRHEFIDYILSRAVDPYKEFANHLIALVNNVAYERKEELVDALAQLIQQ